MKNILITILSVITLFSCKARKATETANNTPVDIDAPVSKNTVFFTEIGKKSTFSSLKINSKINVETDRFVPTLDATFYIENSQKIWVNMAAFINVAKGIATPAGIKAYEKINKTYIDSDFTYLNKMLNVNFIDYQSLQNLLVGKTFLPINEKDFLLTKNAQGYTLSSEKALKIVANGKTNEYFVTLGYTPEYHLRKVVLNNVTTKDSFEIFYENHENLNNEILPKNVKIIIKGQKNSQILIENTKFDFSKMETPFSIPNNYTKTEIK